MEAIYRGFDGLDVSFPAQIGTALCNELESAKEQAQKLRSSVLVTFNGVKMLVSETGARGGYSFVASTGEFGGTWFFKKPSASDPWGVRLSCNSFNLAVNGLGRTRADIYETMDRLSIGASGGSESIGRVDFAVDFFAPLFELLPEHFVMHSNTRRADHIELEELSCHGRSGRVTSVTMGKMPGRQVIVYDKRAEVIARHKVGWWEIWNAGREKEGHHLLDRADASQSAVWRVELRAGKKHLKDRWGIRTWADLDQRLGDMFAQILCAIRHTSPNLDSNRSRWPNSPLWKAVLREVSDDLFEMRSAAEPDLVKHVQREAQDQLLARQMTGLLTNRAALRGMKVHELPSFARKVGDEMASDISKLAERFEKKLGRAAGRYGLGLQN